MTLISWNTASARKRRNSGDGNEEGDHAADLVLEAGVVLLLLLLFLGLVVWASRDVNIAPTIGLDLLAWSTFTA